MDYINDININEAFIHVLENDGSEEIIAEEALDLSEDVYIYIYKHIEKCFKNENLKYAKFNDEQNAIKKMTQDFLSSKNNSIKDVSVNLSKQLYAIMRGNTSIESCDLLVASILTDKGPFIAILKLDHISTFANKIVSKNNKTIIRVEKSSGLPATGKKVEKAAFIKMYSKDNEYDLLVLDRRRASKTEEYGENYFLNNFLGAETFRNDRDMTKELIKETEKWTSSIYNDNPAESLNIKDRLRQKLKEEETIVVNEFAEETFTNENEKERFKEFMKNRELETIDIDKEYLAKKTSKLKFKIDDDISLDIALDSYNDNNRFKIEKNGDGTVNMIIKFVRNYVEK